MMVFESSPLFNFARFICVIKGVVSSATKSSSVVLVVLLLLGFLWIVAQGMAHSYYCHDDRKGLGSKGAD
jgi:hypothetical protein